MKKVSVGRMPSAISSILQRHEILRTKIVQGLGPKALQEVLPFSAALLEICSRMNRSTSTLPRSKLFQFARNHSTCPIVPRSRLCFFPVETGVTFWLYALTRLFGTVCLKALVTFTVHLKLAVAHHLPPPDLPAGTQVSLLRPRATFYI